MGRTINSEVEIKNVFFDEELYPRSSYNWQTGYIYSQSLRAGAKFPKIVLASLDRKLYLVDGKHRMEAHKLLKKKTISAVVHFGWNKKKIFEEAIKSNISHGQNLSPYEKRLIAVKLMEMNFSDKKVSSLIQVPLDKLETFVASRLVNSITGEEIDSEENERVLKEVGKAILKSGIKHFAGQTFTEQELQELQKSQTLFYEKSQRSLLKDLITIIEKGLLDKEDKKVMLLIKKLKILIKGL